MTVVTQEQFNGFIAAYPRPLERSVLHFFEPPVAAYYDFTVGTDWDAVVASVMFTDPPEYRIAHR